MDERIARSTKPPRALRTLAGRVADPGGTAPEAGGGRGKFRVLAVDDTAKDLRDLRTALKNIHAEVFTCQNGKSAVEFMHRETVDLVILDVLMPDMDGYEACRAIKHDPRHKDVPVIFVTGDFKTEDKLKGVEVGAWDYVSKPIDNQEIEVRVKNALTLKRLQDQMKVQALVPEEQAQAQLALQQQINDFQQGMLTAHWHKRFGQLSANFIEEIQFPLTAALGSVRFLMVDDRLSDRMRDNLAGVYVNFRKVEEKLERLRMIGERPNGPGVVSVAQIVNDAAQLLQLELHYHGIAVKYQLDPTCQWYGVRSELARAVLYLLHNAIEAVSYRPRIYSEFTNDETAEVEDVKVVDIKHPEIHLLVESDPPQINIHIADNGPGIPPGNLEHIWDPYFTTKGPPHTGAGLHLARSIARAGGGEMDVLSPNENGMTQLTIALPLYDPADHEEPAPEEAGDETDAQVPEAGDAPAAGPEPGTRPKVKLKLKVKAPATEKAAGEEPPAAA